MKILLFIFLGIIFAGTAFAQCPQGTSLDKATATCQGPVACLYGYYNPTMQMCESLPAKESCPKGTDLDGMTDVCLSSPTCPPATMYDGRKSLCIGLPN